MAVLKVAVVALVAAGCYSPELRDCVTSCELDADCAPGQACGADGMCAAPARTGTCASLAGPDSAPPTDAAVPRDAPPRDAPLDAGLYVELRVRIEDQGSVAVDGVGTCSSGAPQHGDCRFSVRAGAALELHARPGIDRVFESWRTFACGGQGPDCSLTIVTPIEARARFRRE
jgi:hypothetical protein